MPFTDPSPLGDFFFAFLGILFEGAPYILLGTLISGFIDAYLPANLMDRLLPKNRYVAIFMSGLLGAVFPVCECAIVPVIRRLVQKGLPISCAITYMLSAPIVNPIVALSTYSAFSGSLGPGGGNDPDPMFYVYSRIAIAYFVTVLVGIIVQQFSTRSILRKDIYAGIQKSIAAQSSQDHAHVDSASDEHDHGHDHGHGHDHEHEHEHGADKPDRLVQAMRTATRDFLDTGMYFTIGVLITALYRTQIDQAVINRFGESDLLGVPAMMMLAFVLSLCSTSDAFIAAQMQSFSHAAKLAFLTFGPMMDVKLVFMYLAVFRKRFVVMLAVGLFLALGLIFLKWGTMFIIPRG